MGAWNRWVDRCARREGGETLALVRIVAGLAVLANLISTLQAGVPQMLWIDLDYGGLRELKPGRLIEVLGGARPEVIFALIAVILLAAVSLVLGLFAPLAALVCNQGLQALTTLDSNASGAYDTLTTIVLWTLVLCDSGATWSLRARLREGRWWGERRVAAWPRYLLVAQLLIIYTMAGVQKVSSSWIPGGELSALYGILQMPVWARFDMQWLAEPLPYLISRLATLGTWLFELSWPLVGLFLLLGGGAPPSADASPWRRAFLRYDLRLFFVAAGGLMHLGIAALMAVGFFHWIMPAFYVALYRPAELRELGRRIGAPVRAV